MTEVVLSEVAVPEDVALSEHAGWELVRRAERLLDSPRNAEDAESLWRKVRVVEQAMRYAKLSSAVTVAMGRVRLRAEARWGELLGESEHGGDRRSDQVSGRDLKPRPVVVAENKAREVAKVQANAPEVFEEYLAADHDDPPTRAGLFRAADMSAPTRAPRTTEWERKLARGDELQARLARLARDAQWVEAHALDFAYARSTPIADRMRQSVYKIDARLGPIREAIKADHHELRHEREE